MTDPLDLPDGAPILSPTNDPGIRFQRQLVFDMQKHGAGVLVCRDPATGQMLTRGEFFDRHAQALQIEGEVIARG